MNRMKLLGQTLMARDFERQTAELQVRIAVLNRYTAIGPPVTRPVGRPSYGKGEAWLSAVSCNKAVRMKSGSYEKAAVGIHDLA